MSFPARCGRFLTKLVPGLSAAGIAAMAYLAHPNVAARVDNAVYDAMLPLRANSAPSDLPIIIDIDEKSLNEYGQWPWPRYLVADLIRRLDETGAAAIGIDIMFAEPDNSSPDNILANLARDKGIKAAISNIPDAMRDYDKILAGAIAGRPVALGAALRFDQARALPDVPGKINVIERADTDPAGWEKHLQSGDGAVLPLPALLASAPIGLINVAPDSDGIVRSVPLLMRLGGRIYPSLALRSVMLALGTGNIVATIGSDGIESAKVGPYSVDLSRDAAMMVPFAGPSKTYRYYSAGDILKRRVKADELRGKIAFIGTSAPGLLDIRATPTDSFYPGVEVHAAAVDAIVSQNAISAPPWIPGIQILLIALAAAACAALFRRAAPAVCAAGAAAAIAGPAFLSMEMFKDGIFMSPLYPALSAAITYVNFLFIRFFNAESQKKKIKSAFSKFVSPEFVNQLIKAGGDVFGGREKCLTIMFSDIRGFTTISEGLTPIKIVAMLNRYFTGMTRIVRDNKGTVDKFIGDALMAFWNAPVDVPRHAEQAIRSALQMQEALATMNDGLQAEFGVRLKIGLGIHTGPAYVGNMGSDEIMNYTLIGDNVNLASRLEGLCKKYGVGIIISEDTKSGGGDAFAYQYLDSAIVKGKNVPIGIFLPMNHAEADRRAAELAEYSAALDLYARGGFSDARAAFGKLIDGHPGIALYKMYLERCEFLIENPPADWRGIWKFDSK